MKNMVKVRRGGVLPLSVILKMTSRDILYRIKEKLKKYSKKRLAVFYYNLLKDDLPRLRTIRQKALPKRKTRRKKMTKAEKTKFLARLNKGRIKAGLKPIRAKR